MPRGHCQPVAARLLASQPDPSHPVASRLYRICMMLPSTRLALRRMAPAVCALCCFAILAAQPCHSPQKTSPPTNPLPLLPTKPPADKAAADKGTLPPLPPEAHVQQSIELDRKTLNYTVTVGALPVRDAEGKTAGQVVVTAYTVEGDNRPVTFALNGGPGASSVYLNFGAIGPRHLSVGNEGDSPSDPAVAQRQSRHLARLHRSRLH